MTRLRFGSVSATIGLLLALTGCTQQFTGTTINVVLWSSGTSTEQLSETLAENQARTDLRKDAAP